MSLKSYVILILCLSSISCNLNKYRNSPDKQNSYSGIVYGEKHAYQFITPKGWILDTQIASQMGLPALLYLKGEDFNTSDSIMYTKGHDTEEKLYSFIKHDLDEFKKRKPDLIIKNEPLLQLQKNKKAIIKRITDGSQSQPYERIAYIKEEKSIIIFVISSKNLESFNKNEKAFEKFVKSYSFLTSDVRIKN